MKGAQPSLVVGATALALLVAGRVAAALPATVSLLPPCPTKWALGWPCPLCGLTRVVLRLADADVVGAATLAPLPTVIVLAMAGVGVWALAARALGRAPPEPALARVFASRPARAILVVVAVAMYGWALWRHAMTGAP